MNVKCLFKILQRSEELKKEALDLEDINFK